MFRTGTLTISGSFSRLDETRLMKGTKNNGGFGRATDFLQLHELENNDTIRVEGTDDSFGDMPVIMITDAVKVGVENLTTAAAAVRKPARATSSGRATKSANSGSKGRKGTGSRKSAKGSSK